MLEGLGIKSTVPQLHVLLCAHLVPRIDHVLAQTPESEICKKGYCAIALHSLQSQCLITPNLSGLNPKCNLCEYIIYMYYYRAKINGAPGTVACIYGYQYTVKLT